MSVTGQVRVCSGFEGPWQTGHMASLAPFLPSDRPTDSEDAIIDGFFAAQEAAGRILYPHQEEALLAVAAGDHVIAATPTGSGKTTIAYSAVFAAMARGQRSYYTAPIKALVSEKFFDLVSQFRSEERRVGKGCRCACCTSIDT